MKKVFLLASILGFLGTAVVGCNDTPNANTANNSTNTAINTSLENQGLQTIGITLGDLGNPFYVALQKGAEEQAKKIGDGIRVNTVSSAFDLNQQTNQIENFTASNTDIIILNAADKSGIKPAVEKAK